MSKHEKKNSFTQYGVWIGIFALTIVVIIGLAIVGQKKEDTGIGGRSDALSSEVGSTDHIRGNPMSRVSLVEYSDFQCPACGAYYPLVKQLEGEYGNRMQIVYRNFPLTQLHKNALLASQAAEAAGKQGKFFEMHDWLFEHQSEWPELPNVKERFIAYAADDLKIDRKQFEQDLEGADVKAKIDEDLKSGNRSGVQGTPTFYLNGAKIDSPRSYDEFKQLIDAALENSK